MALAEYVKSKSYDGIAYKSALAEEHNLALFDLDCEGSTWLPFADQRSSLMSKQGELQPDPLFLTNYFLAEEPVYST